MFAFGPRWIVAAALAAPALAAPAVAQEAGRTEPGAAAASRLPPPAFPPVPQGAPAGASRAGGSGSVLNGGLKGVGRQSLRGAGASGGVPFVRATGAARAVAGPPQSFVAPGAAPAAAKAPVPAQTKIDPALPPGSRLPIFVRLALESGPLTPGQIHALVEMLVADTAGQREPKSWSGLPGARDPDLNQIVKALAGPTTTDPVAALDGETLRNWFSAVDGSADAAVSYLEWRDRVSVSLELFRALDANHDGSIAFDEFARPLLLNEAREGGRGVDPELLAWAVESASVESPTRFLLDRAAVEALADDELVVLARAQVAAAVAERAARQSSAKAAKDANAAAAGADRAKPSAVPSRRD